MNKNCLDDYRVGCKSIFHLLELIEINANLEKELE
jgi:hypothetical protein